MRKLFRGREPACGHGLESGAIFQEREVDSADRSVALFGNNDLGFALQVGIVLLVDLFAKDKHYQVGILLDRARLAQVGELWTMVPTPALRSAAQLRERNHGHAEFLSQ